MYEYFSQIKLHKVVFANNHDYFHNKLQLLIPVHQHETRFSFDLNLNIPFFRKSKCQNSFIFQAISVWNKLPQEFKEIKNFYSFKKKVKRIFVNKLEIIITDIYN